MARPILRIQLKEYEKQELEKRIKSPTTSKQDHLRAEIILLRAQGIKQNDVVNQLKVSKVCVSKWTSRFFFYSLDGLKDQPGRGRKPTIPIETISTIITKAVQPPAGKTRWSTRTMAEAVGVSNFTVHKIWEKIGIKPHRTKTFKLSNDPCFEEKFWDVIGLYLNPPEKAMVLCCDEKSQCQALERTQKGLPLGIGHIRTKTHDYYRHGIITLFAALNYVTGDIIKRTEEKHTHEEWLRFLKQIERETPKELELHIIADNYSTHKHENVRKWLTRHNRFHMHFTPTGSSWLNLVERFFAAITNDCIRDGSFTSVKDLINQLDLYIKHRTPKPYVWRADGEEILKKIERAKETLCKLNYQTGH